MVKIIFVNVKIKLYGKNVQIIFLGSEACCWFKKKWSKYNFSVVHYWLSLYADVTGIYNVILNANDTE